MIDRATRDWNTFGETEPYFAVLTHDRFLSEQMSAADREAFFAFGEADIAQIFDLIDIAPKSALGTPPSNEICRPRWPQDARTTGVEQVPPRHHRVVFLKQVHDAFSCMASRER